MPPVLDRHSGETGEGGQKPRGVLVERQASPAPLLLVGENERSDGPASGADRHPDRRRNRRAQEPEPFPRHRARRPHHVAQELVLRHDSLGLAPRKTDPRFRFSRSAFAERRQVAAGGVEHADRPTENVLDESVLARQGAEREPGVVESFEEKELVLCLERRGRPVHYFADASTFSRRSCATVCSAGRVGAQVGFHLWLSSRSFSARSSSPRRARIVAISALAS